MQYQTLEYKVQDKLLHLRLHRPEKMNAFTVEMCAELEHAFGAASADDAVRAIVVSGSGKAFCAGMDLGVEGNVFGLDENQRPTSMNDYRQVRDTGGRVTLAIYKCNKAVIAAVNGAAIGIGSTMLLPMDFRIASRQARFGFVFSRLGIVNEACSSWFLPRVVGLPRAMDWLIRGHIFSAEEALAGGLVSEVCEADELLPRATEIAREIADHTSAVSVALIRQMIYRELGARDPMSAHQLESLGVFYTSMNDGREGVQAFREKRDPRYTATVSKDMPPYYPWWKTEA